MTAQELEKLLADVTPGVWVDDFDDGYLGTITDDYGFENPQKQIVRVDGIILAECDSLANARLIALSPTLARRVIAAEKMADALRFLIGDMLALDKDDWASVTIANESLTEWEAAQ